MKKAKTALKPNDFVHLHNHTQYSLLDGLTKVPALVERIKNLGMASVAVTDHGTMSGAVEFYKTAKAGGINPIIGMEAYVAPRD
jgi:DNA polymerase-3 subunit alpha